jgi:hypothetical protein
MSIYSTVRIKLSTRELEAANKNMFLYVHTVGRSLEQRYPEKGIILEHFSFLDVSQRKYQVCNIGTSLATNILTGPYASNNMECSLVILLEY